MKKLIFTSLFIFAAFTLYAQTVPLTLNIENIGSNKGSIVVNICTNVDEFAEREPCKYSFQYLQKKAVSLSRLILIKAGMVLWYIMMKTVIIYLIWLCLANLKKDMVFQITNMELLAQNRLLKKH